MDQLLPVLAQVPQTISLYGPDFVGVILPPLIEVLNKDIPPEKEKERTLAALAICFAVALLLKWNAITTGSPEQLLTTFTLIFAESQTVYKLYFKNSFIRAKIQERLAPTEPTGEG